MLSNELLEKIKTYDWGQSRLALTEATDAIKNAHGNTTETANIEKSLIGVLESDASRAGKQFVCRKLSIIGTELSVPVLAKMLTDEETSDMARFALERIPGEAADAALRDALPKANGKPKVGIIDSLGQRHDKQAVETLNKLVGDSDETVADAAAAALGKIADEQATQALAEAKEKTNGKLQMRVMDSYLLCADKLVADGKKTQALTIYKELSKRQMPESIRAAATKGMINAMK
jgi:HEAT repeat protein